MRRFILMMLFVVVTCSVLPILALADSLLDTNNAGELRMQEKCAVHAEKVARAWGYKDEQQGADSFTYQSHYNQQLRKCFVSIEIITHTFSGNKVTQFVTRAMLDAIEQRQYAEYLWVSSQTKKYWEVPPMECKLNSSSSTEKICKSEDEYKAFVAMYME